MNARVSQPRRALLLGALLALSGRAAQASVTQRAFELDSLRAIDAGPKPYVLTLWGLNCAPCVEVLRELAHWQSRVRVVTVAVDSLDDSEALRDELQRAALGGEAWVFGNAAPEALRHAIDPKWMGEKPRSYLVARNGSRVARSGILKRAEIADWLSRA